MNKKTLVLGASENPARYSHFAVNRLIANGHEVYALGGRIGNIGEVEIHTEIPDESFDTVTLYLSAKNQEKYYDYLEQNPPRRIIFNPGAENPELEERLRDKDVEVIEACTLIMLGTGQY